MAQQLPDEKKIVLVQVLLGETEADKLYEAAAASGRSMGAVAREGIRKILELEAPAGEKTINWQAKPIRGRSY